MLVTPRTSRRPHLRFTIPTLASLLLVSGCFGRRSKPDGQSQQPDDSQEAAQDNPRGKVLDSKAFCALGRHSDDFPVDLDFELPTGPDGQLEALTVQLEAIEASATGKVTASWKLDRDCAVEQAELMFEGDAQAQARLTVDVDNDVTFEDLVWEMPWNTVTLPVGPVPVFISFQLGVTIDGEVRAQDPVRLIVEGRGQVSGKLGITQTGTDVRLDPPESFDIDLEPRVEASMDFAMDVHPAPWVDVRLYGIIGGRISVPADINLACTAVTDPKARACKVDYRFAPTIQPLIGTTTVDKPIWAGPVVPVPLPAKLREGSVDLPVANLGARVHD